MKKWEWNGKTEVYCELDRGRVIVKVPAEIGAIVSVAPEMLEALKMAYRNMDHRPGDCYSNDYMGLCCCGKDVIKSIIDKAEGRDE